jgi:imidazolonepropionase-like amidohydrolase/Tol biopolymer transport system component
MKYRFFTLAIGCLFASLTTAEPVQNTDELSSKNTESIEKKSIETFTETGSWKTISINTDETTWSFVDVSPDGQHLIFDVLGDIYTTSIKGGDAKALTSGISWNFQPRFSPSGDEIVFISDRDGADNIWVMKADGSEPRQVSKERNNNLHNPYWTPDGQWIAARKGYVSERSIPAGSIWLYHQQGSDGVMMIDRLHKEDSQKNIAEPAFSPDGRYMYYSQDITPGTVWEYNKDSTGSLFAIQRFDREKGESETLVSGPGGAVRPIPSPDGKYLAFVKRKPNMQSALYLKELHSGNEWPLYENLSRDNQETAGTHGNYPAYAWTPDSKALVFWSLGKFHRLDIKSKTAATIPITINTTRQVRNTLRFSVDVAPDEFTTRMLRWSQYNPRKNQVLYQALGYLYTQKHDAKKPGKHRRERLTHQNNHFEFWPSYSADGKKVVYSTWDDIELGSIRTVSNKGGRSRVITEQPGHYIEPRFSQDGKKIVYRKISGGFLLSPMWSGAPGIYVTSSKGGKATRVSKTGFNAQFIAGGSRVYFTDQDKEKGLVLKSVTLDGKDERTHASGKWVNDYQLSPDGRWLAFTEQFNAYVLPFTQTGQALDVSRKMTSVPVTQVSKRSGEFLHWSPDSKNLQWSNGPMLYSHDLSNKTQAHKSEAHALDLSFVTQADKPSGTIALTGAKIITMRNDQNSQEVIENGVIIVKDNRIAAIGEKNNIDIPADAYVFDAKGKTIIPGLIDVHAHGAMASNEMIPEQNWQQFSNLAFGVTTIHDPSNDTTEIFAHAEMQRNGQVLGPRTFSTGAILYGALSSSHQTIIDSAEDAEFHVQRLKDAGAISVKSYNQLRRDSRLQVINAAEKLGVMVVPEGGMKFQHNLTHIMDGHTGVEHALPLRRLYEDVSQLWSATETGYTPTFGVAYGGIMGENYWYDHTDVWKNERLMRYAPRTFVDPRAMRRTKAPDEHYNHIAVAEEAKKLRDLGVSVQIGGHGQREGLAAHWEIWSLHLGGFSPWESLRSATIDGARYIGLDKDVGSLEVGKLADLAIIEADPLQDIRSSQMISHTMINGRLYDVTTMSEVGSGKRNRQSFFFELEGGDTLPSATVEAINQKAKRHHWVH